jgi:outer membrane protein assembly factor BamB
MSDITSQLPPTGQAAGARPEAQAPPAAVPQTAATAPRRLRLWPGVVIVALQWLLITVPGWVAPATYTQFLAMFWTPILAALGIVIWWLFASRLRWMDRWFGLVAFVAVAAASYPFWHPKSGIYALIISALPVVTTAWVLWLLATPFLSWPVRRVGLLVVFLLAWDFYALVRFKGVYGDMSGEWAWRFIPTAEETFLAEKAARQPADAPPAAEPAAKVLTAQPGDWPEFRGPNRDGRRTGVRIATDWDARPPKQLWRHRLGPGWSSFAVVGDRLYTQEQRGTDEAVVCYRADTGEEVWAHPDPARFDELVSGAGPRATPTFHKGNIYALGGAGRLNCLDAATGKVRWAHDLVEDAGAKVPVWGFAASPLVVGDLVLVYTGSSEGKGLLAYKVGSGDLAWAKGDAAHSYCSPQLARFDGVEQVLVETDTGLTAFDPAKGDVLWEHPWSMSGMARILQPALLDDAGVLLGTAMTGTRRLKVSRKGDEWKEETVWESRAIKPYFNDLVVYQDHLYGFDGIFFTCVSLKDGKGKWRARGYGNGQVLLLADQGLLLVLSEKGEVALVEASPEDHKEVARFQALKGKTWNHPVVAGGKLFVRNSEEMACYDVAEGSGAAGK